MALSISQPARHIPHWYGIPVRVLLITVIGTLLCFAVSLLLAIVVTATAAALRGIHPDMRVAYREAVPIAIIAGVIVFAIMLVVEIRHYRRAKALSAIERLG